MVRHLSTLQSAATLRHKKEKKSSSLLREIDNMGHLFKQVKITCVYAYGQKQETCNIFMTQQCK